TIKPLLEAQRVWPLLESVGDKPGEAVAANDDVALAAELDRLKSAPETERAQWLAATIRTEVAHVLRVGPESLANDTSLLELGLDSLMAVDLINRLRRRLGNIRFAPQLVYDHPTIAELAVAVAGDIATVETRSFRAESLRGDDAIAGPSVPSTSHRPGGLEGVQYRVKDGPVYTYRRDREGGRPGAILSYAKCFGQKTANVLDSVFEWKYLATPVTPGDGPVAHVLECDGEIVGFSGTLAARFKIEEETMSGLWSTDTHVAPGHR